MNKPKAAGTPRTPRPKPKGPPATQRRKSANEIIVAIQKQVQRDNPELNTFEAREIAKLRYAQGENPLKKPAAAPVPTSASKTVTSPAQRLRSVEKAAFKGPLEWEREVLSGHVFNIATGKRYGYVIMRVGDDYIAIYHPKGDVANITADKRVPNRIGKPAASGTLAVLKKACQDFESSQW